VKVKVERIRAGRRLPDVEYIETRPARRLPANRRERDGEALSEADEPPSKLRLPWQIHRRPD
jgi:hypothetical protein